MELSTVTPAGGPPRPEQDLRPAADAAALIRDPRGAAQASAILPAPQPPSVSQAAAISRSLLDPDQALAPVERVLKPWGVQMLPASTGDRPADAQRRPAGEGAEVDRPPTEG